ncbi:uncharacterized protein T551_02248 [Pneumocystis jirovecii RU7]|uniref:Extracellular mutant protein 11 C-terminal domain-containing protein n=1 Tax=Pneumocystis jirovecii (strain RU7) TaxID=1408657 RepID=A0A0W4ZMN7_PNEJ7|nr:uncharacterized protein T551_02248 [Pneumocystis jirovecii RU7]KTW29632.1 hypothetical protein T551_02248 [Pneumocystis jirovecii RU7]
MTGKSKDNARNIEKNRNQHGLNNIPTYFPRFSRKSYSGRYGVPLVMTKASNTVDLDESEGNEMSENIIEASKIESAECPDRLSVVVGEKDVFVNTNGSKTSVRSISDGRLSDSSESFEKDIHVFGELEQSDAFLPCMQESEQVVGDKDGTFLATEEVSGIQSAQKANFLCDTSVFEEQDVEKIPLSLYNAYTKADTETEQEMVKDKQVEHEEVYDEIKESNDKDLDVSVSISCDSSKDDQILRGKTCDRIVLDSNALVYNDSCNIQASQQKNMQVQESCISLSAYPKEENLLPLTLPDDFSDQERAYAVLSVKEWEDKGLEISKRGLQLIEKVILLRKRKEELLFQVQNMIDLHAEKLIQREESLRLRALDVKKRGKELLDGV